MSKVFEMPVQSVYVHYVTKIEKKGRTKTELNKIICWLTGFSAPEFQAHLKAGTTFEQFFKKAKLNKNASKITGTICGYRIEEIPDPLMKKIRYLDKVVDELAKGKSLEQIMRK